MLTRFPVPARQTRVRSFANAPALAKALAAKPGWLVLDGGVPMPFAPAALGTHTVAGGEASKHWGELEGILAWLAGQRAERGQALVVIGGGATLDLAALAASLYRRGMPLMLVPTTLLGMVDATLGGKTAVDLELDGRLLKNFAGTFYPATEVWLCPDFLTTLPRRERVSGAGETMKTMWIRGKKWDREALGRFVRAAEPSKALARVVLDCLAVKARLVEKDPLDDKRVRELLNFGHTVGHALESAARGRISHGECVLWGMAVESTLLGTGGAKMAAAALDAITELGLELPAEFEKTSEDTWLALLGADKKAKAGKLEMSLLAAPGRVVKKKLAAPLVARAIRAFPESFRRGEGNPRS